MVEYSYIEKKSTKQGAIFLKFSEVVDCIFVHSLIAYIILTSISKTMEFFNKLEQITWFAHPLVVMVIAFTASILRRVTPYNQYSFKHPANIIGTIVFIVAIFTFYKLDKSGVINLIPSN
jgi:hypothetical protein